MSVAVSATGLAIGELQSPSGLPADRPLVMNDQANYRSTLDTLPVTGEDGPAEVLVLGRHRQNPSERRPFDQKHLALNPPGVPELKQLDQLVNDLSRWLRAYPDLDKGHITPS